MNLVIVLGPEQGRRFPLAGGRNVLGRADDCQVQLPSNQISRRHAALIWTDDGRIILEDQGSANGTFLNGMRLSQAVELHPGMQFQLGEFTLTVEPPQAPAGYGGYAGQQAYGGGAQAPVGQGASAGGYGGDAYGGGGYNPDPYGNAPAGHVPGVPGGPGGAAPAVSGIRGQPDLKGQAAGGFQNPGMAPGMAIPSRVTSREENSPAWKLYGRLRFLPWRGQVILAACAAFVLLVGGVIAPLLKGMENQIQAEILARGNLLAQELGARNGEFIRQRLDTRLDLRAILSEPGVRAAYLLDVRGTILAPAEQRGRQKFNAITKESFSTRSAVSRPAQEVEGEEGEPGEYHIVIPIKVISPDRDIAEQVGFAYVVYGVGRLTTDSAQRETRLAFGAFGVAVVLIGMVALLFVLTNMPIRALHEDAELVLRGDLGAVESRARWKELEQVTSSLNRSFERMRSGGGGGFPGL